MEDAYENLKNLFLSSENHNIELGFMILQGIGFSTELYTHLFALQAFHPDSEIRKKSLSQIKKKPAHEFFQTIKPLRKKYPYSKLKKMNEKQFSRALQEFSLIGQIQAGVLGAMAIHLQNKGIRFALIHKSLPPMQILEKCYRNGFLSLADLHLPFLPDEIGLFPQTHTLILDRNDFEELPLGIQNLTKLNRITYESTPLSEKSLRLLESVHPKLMADRYYEIACNSIENNRELEEARRLLNRALKIQPQAANYWNAKGAVYQQFKKYNSGDECFNKALALEPDMPLAWKNKAFGLYKLKKFHQSLEVAEQGLQRFPKNGKASFKSGLLFRKAQALYNLNRLDESEQTYQQALQIDSKNWAILYNIACIYSMKEDKQQTSHYLYRALSLNPSYATIARKDGFFNQVMQEAKFQRFV